MVLKIDELLNRLEQAGGPAEKVPSRNGWELVLAENIGYLVDGARRWEAMAALRSHIGTAPEQILGASDAALSAVVVGIRPAERVARLRLCAELAIAGAPWRAFPGIGAPGVERIELFTGQRPVLALDANGLRVLVRNGYADPTRSYFTTYRQAQKAAGADLPATIPALTRGYQLLHRHGRSVCRRSAPSCQACPLAADCPSAGTSVTLY